MSQEKVKSLSELHCIFIFDDFLHEYVRFTYSKLVDGAKKRLSITRTMN